MCTYQLTLTDAVVENARQAFPTQAAITSWMQQQVERLLKQMAVEHVQEKPLRSISVSNRIKSLSAVPATSSNADYKDEITDVLSQKY